MDAGKFQLIREADRLLSRCGRYVPPVGSVVYIPKSWLVQAVLPVGSTQTFYKEITGDTTWCWRSISAALSAANAAVSVQVLTPDGHFLFNGLIDLTIISGFGSNRYLLSKEISCPPGSKVQVSFDDNLLIASAVQPVSILLGGAYAYYLKDGIRSRCPEQEASDLPRIFKGPNQNILAPSWMYGEGPKTPPGFVDEAFTYGDGVSNVASLTLGGVLSGKASIQMDNDIDFQVRRFLFDVIPGRSVTAGTFLVRIRSGSGYVFTDDYIDVAKYLGSVYFAKGLDVPRGDQIQFDLSFVDSAGSGSIQIECFADGVKRRRVA
jgi:hypothetical protein